MIARGAVGNPWLFSQTLALERGMPATRPTLSERRQLIMEHFQGLVQIMGERRAALAMRGLLLWYTKGLPNSSRFRGSISKIHNLDTLVSTMDHFFSTLEAGFEREYL
jgi:tRNA-dihydrouridine synthase